MLKLLRRFRLPGVFVCLLALTGCETVNPGMLGGLPGVPGMGAFPGMGAGGYGGTSSGAYGDIASTTGNIRTLTSGGDSPAAMMAKIYAAGALIATVQRYAALSASQRQQVETTVTRRYDGFVQKEKRALAPQYARRKAEVNRKAQIRIAEAKAKRPTSVAKVEAEAKREVAKVDLEWEKAARSSVAKNYGTDFAVPVTNADGKAVVAFASVKESGVSVSDSSYQVASSSSSLKSSTKISHSGKTYAVLK
jgi:hypothetical protein